MRNKVGRITNRISTGETTWIRCVKEWFDLVGVVGLLCLGGVLCVWCVVVFVLYMYSYVTVLSVGIIAR